LFLSKGKNCDGEDEDCKAVLIWQVVDDGGRDDYYLEVTPLNPARGSGIWGCTAGLEPQPEIVFKAFKP